MLPTKTTPCSPKATSPPPPKSTSLTRTTINVIYSASPFSISNSLPIAIVTASSTVTIAVPTPLITTARATTTTATVVTVIPPPKNVASRGPALLDQISSEPSLRAL
ncbi:mucin-7-like [Rosa chinensis]|uniref:mucin-7-like n=1 Tax=Rosa chinensis TaxID=74649 RepID=UPI000D0935C1|nr:mucin-7-like [Rosa chinensis]